MYSPTDAKFLREPKSVLISDFSPKKERQKLVISSGKIICSIFWSENFSFFSAKIGFFSKKSFYKFKGVVFVKITVLIAYWTANFI